MAVVIVCQDRRILIENWEAETIVASYSDCKIRCFSAVDRAEILMAAAAKLPIRNPSSLLE